MSKTLEDIYLEMCSKSNKQEEKEECPKCEGEGCDHCDGEGYHMKEAKAPKTDKEDDGEGMDPVGHGDSDIDNDGDSDASDKYLKNRRKAIKKSMKEAASAAIQKQTAGRKQLGSKMANAAQDASSDTQMPLVGGTKPDHRSLPVDIDDTEEKGHTDATKVADKVSAKAGKRMQDKDQGDKLNKLSQVEAYKVPKNFAAMMAKKRKKAGTSEFGSHPDKKKVKKEKVEIDESVNPDLVMRKIHKKYQSQADDISTKLNFIYLTGMGKGDESKFKADLEKIRKKIFAELDKNDIPHSDWYDYLGSMN